MKLLATGWFRPRDAILPGLVALLGTVEIVTAGSAAVGVGVATYVLASLMLCARKVAPVWMPIGVAAIFAVTPLLGFDASQPASWNLLVVIACLSAGLHAPRSQRWLGLGSVLVALGVAMAAMEWLTTFDPNLVFGLIAGVVPWAFGVTLREKLDDTERLAIETERTRIEGAMAAERAVEDERERIAAELHDVLAHTLGEMVVQAAAAGDLVRGLPADAAAALERVADTGRSAIAETGRLLRLIRDEDNELGLGDAGAPPQIAAAPPQARSVASVRWRDAGLPAVLAVGGTLELLASSFHPMWLWIAMIWATAAVLCFRHRFPLAIPALAQLFPMIALVVSGADDLPAAWMFGSALACFAAGSVPRAQLWLGLAAVAAGVVLDGFGAVIAGQLDAEAVGMGLVIFLGSWAAGVALRETLDRSRGLAAAAERDRLQNERDAERAAQGERTRIARELHDVLANSFSVMIVQASLAAARSGNDPDAALAAVAEVERSGRAALDEVGRLLRLIRVGPAIAPTEPQHGIADLPALVDEYTRAGLDVALSLDQSDSQVAAGIALSTYRIVQEALTNVLKHAPGTAVMVSVTNRDGGVVIEVRNTPADAVAPLEVPSGHGLVGLRERVSVFGGGLDASPTPEGGFLVAARLPAAEAV